MALITCPECGRENVSDSATSCPGCGYNINNHFAAIQKQQEELNTQIKREEETRIVTEKLKEQKEQRMANVKIPSFPLPQKEQWIPIILGIILLISTIFVESARSFSFLFGITLLIAGYYSGYNKTIKLFKLAKSDPNAYREYIIEEEDKYRQIAINASRNTPIIKCPICGSTSAEKISTTGRFASVYMLGLASSKIGKQYKCRHCGHMW